MSEIENNQEVAPVGQDKPQPTPQPAPQQGRTDNALKARPCPKDCRKCSMAQQICCSSMMSFQMFGVMNSMIQRLDAQAQKLADFEKRLKAIQSSEAELASPLPIQGDLFEDQK